MKLLRITYIILLTLFLASCSTKEARTNSTVAVIERNILDTNFQLVNGVLLFKNEAFSGVVNTFYNSGELKSKSEYNEGKRNGMYQGWYEEGAKSFERFYTNGLKTGKHLGWYKDGQLKFMYHFNEHGEYDGEVSEWFPNGQLLKMFNYVDGKEDGRQRMWQLDGKIRANYVTKNGERFGLIGLKKCYSVDTKNEIIQ
ncbi:conserved exported protein of unknown function [Tenacibaculum sp. 190130A14a]|uniref:Toxin-antitoxin system YwqK family antitoxin n=1 Tax=Tenacibaculum polynesiense TaxID=3137857 RepID=A0ABM9PF37_9FLAO